MTSIAPTRPALHTASASAWKGQWISAGSATANDDPIGMLGAAQHADFSRTLFRRAFELDTAPEAARIRLTADSRYALWVNGEQIGRGPVRSQPNRLRYDEYDITTALIEGRNTVAIIVTYYGKATSWWMPAAGGSALGQDGVLVAEIDIDDDKIVSDEQWKATKSAAWTQPTGPSHGVPVEIFDARLLDPDWITGAFDDSDWANASVTATTHTGAQGRTRPPAYPYGPLLPRAISFLEGDTLTAELTAATRYPLPEWDSDSPIGRALQVLHSSPVEELPGGLPVTVEGEDVTLLTFDFGRIVAGYVHLDVTAGPGTTVELYYREKPFDPDAAASFTDPTTGARFIARGDDAGFDAQEANGFRFAHVIVHGGSATVNALTIDERLYPRTGPSQFDSDDDELVRLFHAGVRTVQLNSFDAYMDCPTREQRAWVGDAIVHQLVDLTTNEDRGLARNYIVLSDSPRSDGILPMSVVGEIEAGGGVTIGDWSLSWIHGLHSLFRYEGDLEFLRAHLGTAEGILRWYARSIDEHGTLTDVPEWNLVDWASIYLNGRSSILTALWARGLREFAEIADALGDHGRASWARGLYEDARAGFEDFWDAERGLYIDHIVDGDPERPTSQAANATAIVSGLAPRERWSAIVEKITDPARLVVRSWLGREDGTYDIEKMMAQARGLSDADWDVENEIVIGQPFFSYVTHDAVALAGHADKLPDLLRRWSQFLTDGYDTLGECWGWGTPVHGWSATPTRDLIAYVLGIQPATPGFRTARVAPRPGSIGVIAGVAPTPHGPIEVRVDNGTVHLVTPIETEFVHTDGTSETLAPGEHTLTLR
ncbi:alpha-L-rhamnosidase N-terminal domain-containing protein [Microbacterium sp. NPDC077663]|uniref:alpha-L-rhamnosidase-related protein n=1 Tax=Microbacterium sp. NPDC077663 TaxID=3364189 RepID=UPI0037C7BE1C